MNCNDCNKKIINNKYRKIGNIYLCNKCYSNYNKCICCASRFKTVRKFFWFFKEDKCPKCRFIQHYGNPRWNFFRLTNNNDGCFIGVELEVNSNNRINLNNFIEECHNIDYNNFFVFKLDSSIGDNGVEIVSHPATLDFHIHSGYWEDIFDNINKYQITKNQNCGLHFHINRSLFSKEEIAALDLFVNNKVVAKSLEKIGGRKLNEYCKRVNKTVSNWGRKNNNRYTLLNLENSKTIEFRFCKSTANINEFYQRLYLIFSIVAFCKKSCVEKYFKEDDKSMKKYYHFFNFRKKRKFIKEIYTSKNFLFNIYCNFLKEMKFNNLLKTINE